VDGDDKDNDSIHNNDTFTFEDGDDEGDEDDVTATENNTGDDRSEY
jgi:hypothetical protein